MKTNLHLWKKILIWAGGIILTLAIVLTIWGFFFLKPFVVKQIEQSVLKSTDSLYSVSFDKIRYNPTFGRITLINVEVKPDTTAYGKLHLRQKAPNVYAKIKVPKLFLRGVYPVSIFFERRLNISTIKFEKPTVEVFYKKLDYNEKKADKSAKTPYQAISKFVNYLRINRLLIEDIDFTFINRQAVQEDKRRIQHLSIDIADILIDSTSHKATDRFFYAQDYTLSLNEMVFPSKTKPTETKIQDIVISLKNKTMMIGNVQVQPYHKEMVYASKAGGSDRLEAGFKDILIEGIDPQMILLKNKFYAKSISLGSGYLKVFGDGRYVGKKRNKIGEYPHQLLRDLAYKINIEAIKVKNFDVAYAEYNPEVDLVGKITFDNIFGTIRNVTNDTLPLQKNPICSADFNAKFMKSANLNVDFGFNVPSKTGEFTCNGTVGAFDGKLVNRITTALVKAEIDAMNVKKYTFNIRANDYRVSGNGTLLFDNLKVRFLKEDKKVENKLEKHKLISFVANNFIVEDSNPTAKEGIKTGVINTPRVATKGFFGVIWDGLAQSMASCVLKNDKVLKSKEERIALRKEERTERKEERQQNREERREKRELKRQERAEKRK